MVFFALLDPGPDPAVQTRCGSEPENSPKFHVIFHDILVWNRIRIRGSMPLTIDPDPDADTDPSIFIIDLQDANKKLILNKIFCILLFKDFNIIFQR